MNLLLYATAWGPRHGGLNAFNRSLALALAEALGPGHVYCAVLSPDDTDVAEASAAGVILLPIAKDTASSRLDSSWAMDTHEALEAQGVAKIDVCIGHDVISGEIAQRSAGVLKARSAIIHHMDYLSYHGFRGDAARTNDLGDEQSKLFRGCDVLMAVGPLLARSAKRLSNRDDVVQITPGLETAPPQTSSDSQINAVTFGRFDTSNIHIKQGRLAAAGFGAAVREAPLRDARLCIVGVAPSEAEASELRNVADTAAGRMINVLPLEFVSNPAAVMARLAGSNLAMVLSLHEGFGLTAWEAIAAGTPLILSQNSGAFQLINEKLGGRGVGCIKPIDVHGRRTKPFFNAADRDEVAKAVRAVANDIPRAKTDAMALRQMLLDEVGCTWPNAARNILAHLGASASSSTTVTTSPTTPTQLRSVSTTTTLQNAVSECVQMTFAPTQGSYADAYDLTPEVRFGRYRFEVDGLEIECGLKRAELDLSLAGCDIKPGERLGDRPGVSPAIISAPPSRWRIVGPQLDGLLAHRALGDERLCAVQMEGSSAAVSITITCRSKDIDFRYPPSKWPRSPSLQAKVMNLFLAKRLIGAGSEIVLSRAQLELKVDET